MCVALEAVEFPDHEHVAGLEIVQAGFETWPVITGAAGSITMHVALVDAGGQEGIALQVDGLAIVGGRDAHIADHQDVENLKTDFVVHYANPTWFVA